MNRNIITELDEQRLEELMTYAPAYSVESSDNIRRRFLQKAEPKRKPVSGKRVFAGVLIAAALVALSGIAVAATMGFDFGKVYNSFFNNPAAEYKIEIGQTALNNGIEVTLLSAFTDGDRAHALIELKDIDGSRLSDSIRILAKNNVYNFYTGPVSFDGNTNTATLALSFIIGEPVNTGDQLSLAIDAILSGIEYLDAKPLAFDISALAQDSAGISKDEWEDAASGGIKMPGSLGYAGDMEPDISLLPLDGMTFTPDGIDWAVVTNIGLIDGRLHLQTKRTDAYNSDYNYGNFCLLDSIGNHVYNRFSINMNGYEEIVFEVPRGLRDYRLAINGNEIENVLLGPWDISFVVQSEIPRKSIAVIPDMSPYFTKIEATCSPLSTSIRFESVELQGDAMDFVRAISDYYGSFGAPYLTLADGSVIQLDSHGSMFDNLGGTADYESVYFDIGLLESITICGVAYNFE